jgi:general transcription factor 3C polypeptide 5 (transcription factor C subunit 1)
MKLQLIAIRFGRRLTREDFAMTLQAGDATPVGSAGGTSALPLPQLHLTDEEMRILRGRETHGKSTARIGHSVRVRTAAPQEESQPAEEESAVPEDDELVDFAQEDPEDDDELGIGSENELEEDQGIYEEDQEMYEYPDVPVYD